METMEEIEEKELPKRLSMRCNMKKGKAYNAYFRDCEHVFAKGKWIKAFIRANEGHNYDKVYSDFLNKIKNEHISGPDEKELVDIFKYYIFEDGSPEYHRTEWTLDQQKRIVKNKECKRWSYKRKKENVFDNRKVTNVIFNKDVFTEKFPELYEKFKQLYGKRIIAEITSGPISYDYWLKYFNAEYDNVWRFARRNRKMIDFMDVADEFRVNHPYYRPILFFDLKWDRKEENWCGIFTFNYDSDERVVSEKDKEHKRYHADLEKVKRKESRENDKEWQKKEDEIINSLLSKKTNNDENDIKH